MIAQHFHLHHVAGLHPGEAVVERDPGACDGSGTGAAIGLDDVAIDGDLALAERLEIDDGTQAAPDQPLDFDGAAALLAGRGLAPRALQRCPRQHAVFGGDPAAALALEPRRQAIFQGGGDQHMGLAELYETRALGEFHHAAFQRNRAQFVRLSAARPHMCSPHDRARRRLGLLLEHDAGEGKPSVGAGAWDRKRPSPDQFQLITTLPAADASRYALAATAGRPKMAAETTQVLAQFAAALRYEDIPPRVREHCKTLLLDALACAVAGRLGEETGQIAALASGLAQGSESSVIGGDHLSLAGATLLNAYLVTAVTMCDVHRETMTHVTPEVMPPALAIAERDGLSGRALLTAIAAGCEVTTRVGIGTDYPKFRARGWHGPGIFGPFGSAAAVGSLLRFDADTMARAFGLAGSQAAGTFAAWGTPTVKFHQCRGALSGLMAALLAQQKFVATREFLTAKDGGLYNTDVDGGKPDLATADLGSRWER